MNNSNKKPGKIEVVDDRVAEILKKKTPSERLGIGFERWLSARWMLLEMRGQPERWDKPT